MRALLVAVGLLLVAAPAALASHTFEVPKARGDLVVRADRTVAGVLMVGWIGRGARIVVPKGATGISCVDGRLLQRCVRIKRGTRVDVWRVIRPVKLWHEQEGGFAISILRASALRDVVFMGAGRVRLRGHGSYRTDGAEPVSYAARDRTVSVILKP
ncbi:MAG: hypothetical protein ACO3KD_02410 [Gaiellales bacterium]